MAINRSLWYESFDLDDIPKWLCPECEVGWIELKEKELRSIETVTSKRRRADPDYEDELQRENFSGRLVCQNQNCGESVFVMGEMREEEQVTEEIDEHELVEFVDVYYPRFFFPTLQLFRIPDSSPWDVVETTNNAFALYWQDRSAAGNAVRKVVELILDDRRIRKTKTRNGKRSRIGLSQRLKLFKEKNASVAGTLNAIKWIGDVGSHTVDIDTEDLLDGLELLEFALEELYGESHQQKMHRLRDSINKKTQR